MFDPRVRQLAEVLVTYSTRVKKGDVVLINASGTDCLPLVKELYSLCLARGAKYVEYSFHIPEIDRHFYNTATKSQLSFFPQHKLDFMKQVNVFISISGSPNSMVMAQANQKNMIAWSKVTRPIVDWRVKNTRWVITRYPTHGAAQEAKMSLEEYEEYLFAACCIDWEAESRKQEKLKRLMDKADTVRIKASDTDLSFSIRGLDGIKCDGRFNIPDGEVFTAPVRDSVEGHITYNCPTIYQGKEFNGVRLEFAKGRIVKASAPGMDDELNRILDTDEGARFIGEFAIGVNPNIRVPMRNILFDEKIFGSIHFTPGQCYDECDNGNRSAVHWDMVKLLKGDGEIWFDNHLIQKDGLFVHKDLVSLNPARE
ncbi:peptidase M29 aminopeptidase II [Geobacter metallireducens RCH3]|uniref:Leucyl aminopeptidase AmpS, putative n=1 Tax=Geobacter metallireducens (strain ATCC 53774 / DSM 7210 / GS-15) TaxID=269799 RepID=Q39V98_GEOMG|nr:aminopeptidase [Geobacter metallireducens]ABB31826.1 leucyl aminopeptidase AmpS, putative [Geobacter metallireducens GS-15]EHP89292.1 peptidase M29 aminopeptidase II [Geobacter metallireducens RCH3]